MSGTHFNLLTGKRFGPLLATQALGAFNDNVFKNALVMLILFRIATGDPEHAQLLVTTAAGIFILPFLLFSALGGQLADKMEKPPLVRKLKVAEILLMATAAAGFALHSTAILMLVLFFMGAQSALFSPLKYSLVPELLKEDELIAGNAMIEGSVFLAILTGTIIGGLVVLMEHGTLWISSLAILIATIGWLTSRMIPHTPARDATLRINPNIFAETWDILSHAYSERKVWPALVANGWFYFVGATFLAQFPNFAKVALNANEQVVTAFLTAFSVGIALGAYLCERFLRGEITWRLLPFAALGMTVFSLDLVWAVQYAEVSATTIGLLEFLSHPAHWRILFDLTMVAVNGGLYIVPLLAIIQSRSTPEHRARTLAANNILFAGFTVASALFCAFMLQTGHTVTEIFLFVALANGVVTLFIAVKLPQFLVKPTLALIFRALFRVELHGFDNLAKVKGRAIFVSNHLSYLDAMLLAVFLPDEPVFVINKYIAERWWVKPWLSLVRTFKVDPTSPYATKSIIRASAVIDRLVIFPEGRLTETGRLMKIYDGTGLIAEKTSAELIPLHLDGPQYTPFGLLQGKVRTRWFPKVHIRMHSPVTLSAPEHLSRREKRHYLADALYEVMNETAFTSEFHDQTLFQAMLETRNIQGGKTSAVKDPVGKFISYDRLITGSIALGEKLQSRLAGQTNVGILLPTGIGALMSFLGLQAIGRTPAMLNFTVGSGPMLSACQAAEVRTIVTAHKFVEMAKLQETVAELEKHCTIIYLEDVKASLTTLDRITAALKATFASPRSFPGDNHSPAVILFTSGSEGAPKGVVLSHANILANCRQLAARLDFNPTDTLLNALPMFHSFGLTGGTLLPLLYGVKTALYPSPLHYKVIPEYAYELSATILFGTDTFYNGYARRAHPYDFYRVRFAFAGAEKLRDETRQLWMNKFGIRIMEGYGATETAPALSVNTPMHYQAGTVGRLLPGIEHRLEPVPGIEQGGRLHVKGPNVMLGYVRASNPGELEPPENGWYDTGDIVHIDAQGFVKILGRAKRFAKIAGEMVSLTAAEDLAKNTWSDSLHAVVALPDGKKGEQLILVTTQEDASRDMLRSKAKEKGLGEIMIPRHILVLAKLPVLGTGKTDYPQLDRIAREKLSV